MPSKVDSVFDRTVADLRKLELNGEWYVIPSFNGYSSVTKTPTTDVYCMEVYLGPSHDKPGYDAYAVVQAFLPKYPSLSLILMVERKQTDGSPSSGPIYYNPQVDRRFTNVLVTMHSALNPLDPTGQNRSLLVQSFHASLTLSDLILASINSSRIIGRFKRDGQLAQIAVDYDDRLMIFVSNLMIPLTRIIKDIDYVERTKTISDIKIPLRNPNGSYYLIEDNSTALDQGFEIAKGYIDAHYKKSGYIPPN